MNVQPKLQTKKSIFSIISALAVEHKAINLGQGFPDYETDIQLTQHIANTLEEGFNQYAPMAGALSLRKTIADKINHCYHQESRLHKSQGLLL